MEALPVFFRAIRIDMPVDAVYRRLGFKRGVTEISQAQQAEIEAAMDDSDGLVELKGSAVVLSVDRLDEGRVTLGSGDVLRSSNVAHMLDASKEVLFMGSTAGSRVMEEIGRDSSGGNLSRAVVMDAVASEMADKALDWITGYMGRELVRHGKRLSPRRFSAGYGAFALENQKIRNERLQLWEIGVSLTGSCILVPEKSVTALAGIGPSAE